MDSVTSLSHLAQRLSDLLRTGVELPGVDLPPTRGSTPNTAGVPRAASVVGRSFSDRGTGTGQTQALNDSHRQCQH